MSEKKKLDELHQQSIQQIEAYIKMKGDINEKDHTAIEAAKNEWLAAWNKFQEALLILERIEI